jgi:hypothetical protein
MDPGFPSLYSFVYGPWISLFIFFCLWTLDFLFIFFLDGPDPFKDELGQIWCCREEPKLCPYTCPHRVHRVAMTTFWRTFYHEGKISPDWEGALLPPITIFTSCTNLRCTLQLREQINTPPVSHLPPICTLCLPLWHLIGAEWEESELLRCLLLFHILSILQHSPKMWNRESLPFPYLCQMNKALNNRNMCLE